MTRKYLDILIPISIFLAISVVFQFSSPNIPDPDSFYHIKHAEFYRQNGFLNPNFESMYYSVIRTMASDIWYGFHILLIPFSGFKDTLGIKLAGVFLTFSIFIGLWFVFHRHKINWPAFWPILIFISAPNIMNRFLMMRPHLLSLALSVLLYSFFVSGGLGWILALSAFVSWIHLSLIWVPGLIFAVVCGVKLFFEKKLIWREGSVLIIGLILGWIARPNPIGSLKLAYVQVIQLMAQKSNEATLLFGRELFPLSPQTLFQNFSAFTLLWILAIAILIVGRRMFKNQPSEFKTLTFSSLILSVLFFIMTIWVARRAHDFWIPFGAIFMAIIYTVLWQHSHILKNVRMLSSLFLVSVFVFLVFYTPWRNSISLEEQAIPPDKFKEAALWLKDNSQPGDIVFNLRWSDFPMLYFWDQKNYYIGGMDPIFQYAYNDKLYWKFHYLSADQVTQKTCPAPACTATMLEDTYTVLRNDFKAKYVVLEKSRNPAVYHFLDTDSRFEKKLETKDTAVFLIK